MLEGLGFILAALAAASAATVAGFGSSALLLPIALLFMELRPAIFVVAVFHLFNNVFKVRTFWKHIEFRLFVTFGIPSIILSLFGALLGARLPLPALRRILGLLLMLYALLSWWKPRLSLSSSLRNALLGGSLSGLLAGLMGLGGAVRAVFLIGFPLSKTAYVGTSAIIAAVIDLARIPAYLFSGYADERTRLVLLPFLILAAYIGVRLGQVLLQRLPQELFRKIVLAALFLVGLKILL